MAPEPNKPNIVLRPVNREPSPPPTEKQTTGIRFKRIEEVVCPHCKARVPITTAQPLSTIPCPNCGGKVFVQSRIDGFMIYQHIGQGEMGEIYRATDESLNRDVAIKLVRGCNSEDPLSRERLRQEACSAGRLNHPRVAQVHALNFSNGNPYLVMELVRGLDFAQRLEREGPLPERDVLRMALDIADGLSALNREGLVHGDIKPANIVLDRDGNAKLVDFGLSGMTRRDSTGSLVGTPNYIAPELIKGSPDTHRSDLYSFGATLYHLLSGHLPHEGKTPAELLKARLFLKPTPIERHAHNVSQPIRKLVMRMLDPIPEKRPSDSEEVAGELRQALDLLDKQRVTAKTVKKLPVDEPSPKRNRLFPFRKSRKRSMLIMIGVASVAFILIIALDYYLGLLPAWVYSSSGPPSASHVVHQPPPASAKKTAGKARLPSLQETTAELLSPDDFLVEKKVVWQSSNLGNETQVGSTMQVGEMLIIQGAGVDMWKGYDRCRFVWTQTKGNYAFSARVQAIADNHPLAISGILVKGDEAANGPSLFFGFLGNGEVFLQTRQVNNRTIAVRRSSRPVKLPCYLRLIRRGSLFDAALSSNGKIWEPFAASIFELPQDSTVGLAVAAQDPNTLATAKFNDIHLRTPRSAETAAGRKP